MRTPSTLSILLVSLVGCGGAQTPVNNAPPPAEEEAAAAPEPVLVSESFQHDALQIPLAGTLDPATQIVMGEQTITGNGDGTFTLSGQHINPLP